MGRRQGGDLTRQFRADRAAGSGDQNPPARDQGPHGRPVEDLLRPAQQILDLHGLHFQFRPAISPALKIG